MIYLQIGDIVLVKGQNSLSRVIEDIEDAISKGYKYIILEAGTGTGKGHELIARRI